MLIVRLKIPKNTITDNLQSDQPENFHEFLCAYVDIFTKSVYATTCYTYNHLRGIINNKHLVVIFGDKELCVILLIRQTIRISYRKWLTMVLKMVFIE